jgi:type I restriction enzyme, S subunit
MLENNNLKKQLRFKDDNGNDFPEWEVKTLGDVGIVLNGLTYSPDDIDEEGVLVLRSSNVKDRRLVFENNVYVKSEKFTPVKESDILICVRNGSKNLIGKNAIIDKNTEGLAFGAFMTIYRSNYNSFLFHWFDTDEYQKAVNLNLGATINSINGSDLKKFKIPFPCPEEQTKIANFLSSIDEKIEKMEQELAELKSYKKGVMQLIFDNENAGNAHFVERERERE